MALVNFARRYFGHSYSQHEGILILTVAAFALSGSTAWSRVRTSASDSSQLRYEAPIGHRQPRIRDLPTDVQRRELQFNGVGRDELDGLINRRICRGC